MSVDPARIQFLNERPRRPDRRFVLYWMQQSQRVEENPALEYAVQQANELGLPPVVVFGLTDTYPEANWRHYTFMLKGLQETKEALTERGIHLVIQLGEPPEVALSWAQQAAVLMTDRGYLRHQKKWRSHVGQRAPCQAVQVEGDVVVPVELVTDKAEYAARTIRPKIQEHLDRFLTVSDRTPVRAPSNDLDVREGLSLNRTDAVTEQLDLDRRVAPVRPLYRGGTSRGKACLQSFRRTQLQGYDENRNQVQSSSVSHMSKYLHFGQLSVTWIAQQIQDSTTPEPDINSYLEELIVRRELAINHVHFRPNTYDKCACLPEWARESLDEHADDDREFVYSQSALVAGETHDPYWNAAMKEMRETGYMHNYMRMYWGKKILEWSPDPQTAFTRTLTLNNRYFLDGLDPNSYANVAWIFGLHDRGWKERPVYGKVRYMSKNGLERKANPEAYIEKVDRLADQVVRHED